MTTELSKYILYNFILGKFNNIIYNFDITYDLVAENIMNIRQWTSKNRH